ncbi:PKD-like family lipoprotein [Sphingobacterium psychroaquaticum]|uniref:PKD-like family protein n=1 Tax=Sphingobacterium psychroaquaticum TaxID=561061 RepID=A0A1X7IBI5_9SPHI|nr:PKD-like family lipoprotein [Sphingobacterium psychroaquaticum]SMG11799.1 PKD-like family protein [Sphingobacterium psychroaquaticum]
MNRILKTMLLIVSGCVLYISCYKDKGNYDYLDLDRAVIDTANLNILDAYAIYRYDELHISPKIIYQGATLKSKEEVAGKLSFTWAIYQATAGGKVYSRDTLSTDITLQKKIEKPAGKWIVLLTVKNMETQVEEYMKFAVQVDEQLSDGWMLLYEKNGNTDVGLIVDDWSKKGVTQSRMFTDMFLQSNGFSLAGEPRALLHSAAPLASAEVLIASSQEIVAVEKSSFQVFYPFDKLFWNIQRGGELKYASASNLRKEVVIYDNKVHTANFASAGTSRANYFGAGYNGTYGDLSAWSATAFGASFEAVVYDKTAKNFKNVPVSGTSVQPFVAQATTGAFDVNSVGLDPEAFDWGRGNGTPNVAYEYSVMKNASQRYLLVTNFTNATANQLGIGKYPVNGIALNTPVTSLASAFGGNYALLSTAKSLYLHRYMQNGDATVEWTAPAGEEITCVRLQKFFYNPQVALLFLPKPNTVVYVATWDPSAAVGKVYAYLIDPTNGTMDKSSERKYSGFGKIKEMAYKWNL